MAGEVDFGRRAFAVASALAFPRLCGGPGERPAREAVRRAFAEAGLSPVEEFFACSDYPLRVAARWALAPTGLLLAASALLLLGRHPLAALVLALPAFLPAAFLASRTHARGRVMNRRAANVVGRLPAPPDAARDIILVAHYDSKSQRFPIWLRVLLYLAGGFGSLALIALITAGAVLELLGAAAPLAPAAAIAAGALLLVDVSLLFNNIADWSDGALDNAAGVGIITEIAARLLADPPAGARVWAVATAAEEIGLWGSAAFVRAHAAELAPARTAVLNFDGCGGSLEVSVLAGRGLLMKKHSAELVERAAEEATRLGMPLRRLSIPFGMNTDLAPFLRAGYRGVDFVGLAGQSHLSLDRMALVREAGLADHVRLGLSLARRLAENLR